MGLLFNKKANTYAQGLYSWAGEQATAHAGTPDEPYYIGVMISVSIATRRWAPTPYEREQTAAQWGENRSRYEAGFEDATELLRKIQRQQKIPRSYEEALSAPYSQPL